MGWTVERTDEFEAWFASLEAADQIGVDYSISILSQAGPSIGRPHVDTVTGSRFPNMKELRTQSKGNPIRSFFAFDPRRTAILLIGGNKRGDDRFYRRMIRQAEDLYQAHLDQLKG